MVKEKKFKKVALEVSLFKKKKKKINKYFSFKFNF